MYSLLEYLDCVLFHPLRRVGVYLKGSGYVLVFSRYVDGAAKNYGFVSHFVSKELVKAQPGVGNVFLLCSSAKFGVMASKYLYINDATIAGHADNSASGTVNGITYNNSGYVLRYVIGV